MNISDYVDTYVLYKNYAFMLHIHKHIDVLFIYT